MERQRGWQLISLSLFSGRRLQNVSAFPYYFFLRVRDGLARHSTRYFPILDERPVLKIPPHLSSFALSLSFHAPVARKVGICELRTRK